MPQRPMVTHRKWSWSDEQGWIGSYRVPVGAPVKYGGNPIFTDPNSSPPTVTGKSIIRQPWLADDGKVYPYWLFYCGKTTDKELFVCHSPDGITWTVGNGGVAIITGNGPGAWRGALMNGISAIYDDSDSTWKMWINGRRAGPVYAVGYASAPHPEGPWTDSGQLFDSVGYPFLVADGIGVLKLGNLYYMGVNYQETVGPPAERTIWAFLGTDETTFTEWGRIVDLGAVDEWDDVQVKQFCMFWNQGVWYCWYAGDNGNGLLDIGLATSYSGFRTFDKYPLNPVMVRGANLTWDDADVIMPFVIQVEDTFWMYYTGFDGQERDLGIAYIPVAP